MFTTLMTEVQTLSHGWPGLIFGYAASGGPMLAGLIRERARIPKLLLAPALAVPVTIGAGIVNSLIDPLWRGLGVAGGGFLELALDTGVAAGVGYLSGRAIARHHSEAGTVRRGTLIEESDGSASERRKPTEKDSEHVARESVRENDRERAAPATRSRSADSQLTLCGLPIPREDETKHFKFIGTTGTGKSTAICEILKGALERGDRAIIADPDGGYLRRFYSEARGDVILNPFEPRAARWDLYGEIKNNYDVEQLTRSLIPDHAGSERSWREYARTFLGAVIEQTRDADVKEVPELFRLLVNADVSELKVLLEGTPAQPFLDDHNIKMFDSIRSVAISAVSSLRYVAEQEGPPLSVRNWVNEDRGVLFIPYRAGQIAALRSTVSAWMRLAIFETMNHEPGDRRLWFVVDELDALGQIDGLKDALARVRKFGGRCLLGLQSIAQVSGTYGHAEAQTIVENCSNTLILRCGGSENGGTAQFASRLIGQREVVRTSESRSRRGLQIIPTVSRSEQLSIEPAVLDSEIEQLPDLRGFLKLASSRSWRRVSLMLPEAVRSSEVWSKLREEAKRVWVSVKQRYGEWDGVGSNVARDSGGRADSPGRPDASDDLDR
jgi:hypothetical protein